MDLRVQRSELTTMQDAKPWHERGPPKPENIDISTCGGLVKWHTRWSLKPVRESA